MLRYNIKDDSIAKLSFSSDEILTTVYNYIFILGTKSFQAIILAI